jgi:diaminohydroxyphosphoribosylaminopyrimidine deaminase/5-amino-6-(5-phosphoribosylamino)uracil reductase
MNESNTSDTTTHQLLVCTDEDGMRAALAWSARGRGWTSPRPSVGCVLVQNGEVIGGGHTQPGNGNPHAEVVALRQAAANGVSTRGATAYVTLEPCSHWATTPPCTNALIKAGITRVVYGVRDPNPEVNGRGMRLLRKRYRSYSEFMRDECIRAQQEFLKHITTGLPFVTLKCATSLDGKIATRIGQSQWITNAASRRHAHRLRHEHDAVLVGINTVITDDPQLNVRLEGEWKQPQRIVVDSWGRIPLDAKLLNDGGAPVIIATTASVPSQKRQELEARGARVLVLPLEGGQVSLSHLWQTLPSANIYSVLIEGGAGVAASALRSGSVDKVVCFVAPILIGGDGLSVFETLGIEQLSDAPRLIDVQTEDFEGDILISGFTRPLVP